MKATIFKYILKLQLKSVLFVSFFMFCLILFFDFAEVARKFPISNFDQIVFALRLSLLHTPRVFCEIMHYIYFVAATFNLWHLCSSNQITILKSSGRSPQQILYPFFFFACCVSVFWLFILQPLQNYADEKYREIAYSKFQEVNGNIWIDYPKNGQLIFLNKITEDHIEGLYIFDTLQNKKIFAKEATISCDCWDLKDVVIVNNNTSNISNKSDMTLHNKISKDLIQMLPKAPKRHTIYSLWNVYKIQKANFVGVQAYEFALHKLLANCVYFILFAIIAAIICFPINRYRTKTGIATQMILITISLRFASNLMDSLVRTSVIGVVLGAWAVVIIALLVSLMVLTWKEI